MGKKGLKKSGINEILIDRLLGKKPIVNNEPPSCEARKDRKKLRENPNSSIKGKSNSVQHNASKTSPPQGSDKRSNLESKSCELLRDLLEKKGLKKSGVKEVLIDRLLGKEPIEDKKSLPWQHSEAKKDLKKLLEDQNSSIKCKSVPEIYQSDKRYEEWGQKKFEKHYKILKEQVAEKKRRVKQDDIAAAEHKKNFPRGAETKRGYPHWNTHPAKEMLETDIANGLHKEKKPRQIRKTRDEYKVFPKAVFVKRVHHEITKQSAAKFWGIKRNKKGMKRYLEDIEKRKNM